MQEYDVKNTLPFTKYSSPIFDQSAQRKIRTPNIPQKD